MPVVLKKRSDIHARREKVVTSHPIYGISFLIIQCDFRAARLNDGHGKDEAWLPWYCITRKWIDHGGHPSCSHLLVRFANIYGIVRRTVGHILCRAVLIFTLNVKTARHKASREFNES